MPAPGGVFQLLHAARTYYTAQTGVVLFLVSCANWARHLGARHHPLVRLKWRERARAPCLLWRHPFYARTHRLCECRTHRRRFIIIQYGRARTQPPHLYTVLYASHLVYPFSVCTTHIQTAAYSYNIWYKVTRILSRTGKRYGNRYDNRIRVIYDRTPCPRDVLRNIQYWKKIEHSLSGTLIVPRAKSTITNMIKNFTNSKNVFTRLLFCYSINYAFYDNNNIFVNIYQNTKKI